jgi:large repetitive protein
MQAPSDDPRPQRPPSASPVAAAIELGMTPLAIDDRGKPSLLRAGSVAPAPAATATESAIQHVGRLSAAWGVADTALPKLQGLGEVPAPGATIARVRQTIDGLPIDGGELRVLVREGGELVATNGVLISADTPRQAATFSIDDAQAVARSVAHNYQRSFDAAALATRDVRTDGSRTIRGRDGNLDVQMARAQKAWRNTGTMLQPVWIVEAYAGDASSTDGDAFRTVLTADGTRVISHRSLISDIAFNYRVFAEPDGDLRPLDGPIADFSPHPTGTPDGSYPAYTTSTLVSVDGLNHPAGQTAPDPWLLSTRTETLGNNVEAYSDVNPPSGLTFGDFRATVTGTRTFDRAYDLNAGPLTSQAQQMAAITSAFYGINWLHDFWYDAGFTEAAGNAQDNNYGRGGQDRDAMLAETQDNALGGSLNNANMATPADGLPPRMQIFVWSGKETRSLTVLPANRTPPVGTASFGPTNFDVTAPIVLGIDGEGAANDGCTALTNDVTGKIVLVDRGNCSFKLKALNIQDAGGVGMILANNAAGAPPPGLGNDATIPTSPTIGSLSVTLEEGNQIKAELGAGEVTGTLHRLVGHQLDGSLDSTLLAHEFGHYLHHRLQDCTSTWCRAISEGWGDFLALMLMVKDGDNYDGAYPFSIYTTQSFTSDPAYFGIRRAPYSADPAINSLSYRHMADGEPLPTNHPFLPVGVNSQVHNAGEVWARTLWEVYASLLKAPGATFSTTRAKMAKYVVSGLLMAPKDGTPTETRDAILSVVESAADREIMTQAFARRGFGSCAITPGRESQNFVGIVESTLVAGRSVVGSIAFNEAKSCDNDDVLDAGETAMLSLPIANQGHKELKDVKVTVTAADPAIRVATGTTTIASLAPGQTRDLAVEVSVDKGATGMIAGNFIVKIETADDCVTMREVPYAVRINVDDVPATSAIDRFDATSIWQQTGATVPVWSQITETALDRAWHGVDSSDESDVKLESPAVKVSATAPFKVSFTHHFEFEYSDGTAWDGGVIEYSTDNGATWMDVTAVAGVQPGYNYTLRTGAGNVLGGRMGYSNKNPAHPNTDTVTLDFGTNLAGMSVRLRFRIGTDGAVGAPGWTIDDVQFEGIEGTPFPTQVEDRTACGVDPPPPPPPPPLPPPDDQPGCCDAGTIRGSNLVLTLGLLGILLRRRRRRR